MRAILFLLPVFIFLLLPGSASAQLVACSGLDCGTCEFVATAKKVFQFLLTLLSILATIILVIVGLRLVTSGGSEEAKTKAKTALWNIVIGLFLVIAAFAIIDTIMKVLVRSDSTLLLNWNEVQCLHAIVPKAQSITLGGDKGALYGLSTLPKVSGDALCNDEYLSTHFPGQETVAQCVMQGESSCGAHFYSTTDLASDGAGKRIPFSMSPWQINISVHDITSEDVNNGCKRQIKCTDAFNGKDYSATLASREIYNQCVDALKNSNCSGAVAKRIYREAGNSWSPWSAYSRNNCGR